MWSKIFILVFVLMCVLGNNVFAGEIFGTLLISINGEHPFPAGYGVRILFRYDGSQAETLTDDYGRYRLFIPVNTPGTLEVQHLPNNAPQNTVAVPDPVISFRTSTSYDLLLSLVETASGIDAELTIWQLWQEKLY